MGSVQPSVCTTSVFHVVLFWFVYDTSAVRRPTLTIGVSLERKNTWLSTGENIFWKYITLKFLTFRQFICPLSMFLKEILFASLTNAIDMKIERVLTGFLIGWTISLNFQVYGVCEGCKGDYLPICVQTFPCVNESFWLAKYFHPFKLC
jgi:hypothetical protein